MQKAPLHLIALVLIACCSGCASWQLPFATSQTQALPSMERELNLARLAERQGQTDQALKLFNVILEAQPEHPMALHRTGVIAARQGKLDLAIERLLAAKSVNEGNAELLGDIGFVEYRRGEFRNAEQALTEALQLEPNDQRIANNLGLAIGIQGRLDEAKTIFNRAGTPAEATANLAYVRSQLGDVGGAIDDYHQALDEDSELRVAAHALVQLDRYAHRKSSGARPNRREREQIAQNARGNEALVYDRAAQLVASSNASIQRREVPAPAQGAAAASLQPIVSATTPTVAPAASNETPAQVAVVSYEEAVVPVVETHRTAAIPAHLDAREALLESQSSQVAIAKSQPDVEPTVELGQSWQIGNSSTWGLSNASHVD